MKLDKYEVLKTYFGYESFREGQEELIDGILEGRDVLGIMPTGAGKSICYQVPALCMSGITIVVSPLISLMMDQVKALNQAGVHAAYINSSLTENQIAKALANAAKGQYKIIYVAPERLETERFISFAGQAKISMVTVDEAHCISQWGQDFRPSYLKILKFIETLPKRPVVSAFTATATPVVKEDIVRILQLNAPKVLVTGFNRENLYFGVKYSKQKEEQLFDYLQNHLEESGIIYCATRKNVDKVWDFLKERGLPVARYHAGLTPEERKSNQEDFIYDRKPIVVATNAFGMGIDKSNVRYVVHFNMPQSLENYYQEAGRAGRDGAAAECIIFYSPQDTIINRYLIENKNANGELSPEQTETVRKQDMERLSAMVGYCKTEHCLREYILRYFGTNRWKNIAGKYCGNCSCCLRESAGRSYGPYDCSDGYGGYAGNKRYGSYNGKDSYSRHEGCEDYDRYVGKNSFSRHENYEIQEIYEGYGYGNLWEDEPMDLYADVHKASDAREYKGIRIASPYGTGLYGESKSAPASQNHISALDERQQELYALLKKKRREIAENENIPPYMVFTDRSLLDMCVKMPRTKAEMLKVNGVGENKFSRYGNLFLRCIEEYGEATT